MYDVIIIGAGVTGLGAAWYLTETLGKRTLLLEQFPFPHQFGSSAGHSRLTRQLYEDYFNCNLMKEATEMWRDLENKCKLKLFIENGLLMFGYPSKMKVYLDAIKTSNICAHVISQNEVKEKFPVLNIPSDCITILDPVGGILRADKCLQALMNRSLKYGLEFHEMEKVLDISVISNDEIKLKTNKDNYTTKSVILATGIWSPKILEKLECKLPLEPVQIHYSYFNSLTKDLDSFNYDNFPSFISVNEDIYGCSAMEYPGCLKIGDFTSDPISVDSLNTDGIHSDSKDSSLNNIKHFLSNVVPNADSSPVKVASCVITRTPDNQPIIDRHYKYPNIIIGCGFCGCGFKTGVIHGKLLANLATNQNNDYDLKYFSISRFD